MNEHIRILSGSTVTVNLLASILEENNISVIVRDNANSASLAGFGSQPNDVDLLVAESDVDRAIELINDFQKESE